MPERGCVQNAECVELDQGGTSCHMYVDERRVVSGYWRCVIAIAIREWKVAVEAGKNRGEVCAAREQPAWREPTARATGH